MELQSLAALVSSQTGDLNIYAGFLFAALEDALPAQYLQVERRQSMMGRLRGKEPDVVSVSVRLRENRFVLRRPDPSAPTESVICHEVGGVVLSRQSVPLPQWSLALAAALQELAADNAEAAAALARLTNFNV
jgi:hypothetical protein